MTATVLIVDDEPLVLESLGRLLRMRGLEVLLARDGVSGLQAAVKFRPDYVVCDVRMPNMDGPSMVRSMHRTYEHEGWPWPRVVLVTGFNDLHAGEMQELPVEGVLQKPATARDIMDALALQGAA